MDALPGSAPDAEHAVPAWAADALVQAGRRLDQRGWVPATAGNLSFRVAADRIAITRSGVHEGFLRPEDVVLVYGAGRSLTPAARPSAETGLHR